MHAKGERCLSGWSSIEIMLVLSILTQQFLQRNTDGKKKVEAMLLLRRLPS